VLDGLKPYFSKLPLLWRARAATLHDLGRKREALHDYNTYLAREQDDDAEGLRAILLCELHEYLSAL